MSQISKFRENILKICLFTIIYMSSSYNITIMNGTLIIILCFLASIVGLFIINEFKMNKRLLLIILFIFSNIIITSIISGDSLKNIFIMMSVILISFIFTTSVEYRVYRKIYTDIIFYIAISSLVAYIVSITFPDIIRLFPKTYPRENLEVYNLGITFANLKGDIIRNMGLFWEPGAFQTYLILGLILEIWSTESTRKSVIIAYTLALITTFSSTGIIAGFLVLMTYLLDGSKQKSKNIIRLLPKILVILTILILLYNALPEDIQYMFLGKITTYFENDYTGQVTSASVRFDSVIEPLKDYIKSPILGIGYNGLCNSVIDKGHTMTTCTPVNWFASYGIIFGFICVIGLCKLSSKLSNIYVCKILILIAIFTSIFSEEYLRNISIWIFILYGYTMTIHKCSYNIKS